MFMVSSMEVESAMTRLMVFLHRNMEKQSREKQKNDPEGYGRRMEAMEKFFITDAINLEIRYNKYIK